MPKRVIRLCSLSRPFSQSVGQFIISSPLNVLVGFFLHGLCQCFPFFFGNHLIGASFEKFDCGGHEFVVHASVTTLLSLNWYQPLRTLGCAWAWQGHSGPRRFRL